MTNLQYENILDLIISFGFAIMIMIAALGVGLIDGQEEIKKIINDKS